MKRFLGGILLSVATVLILLAAAEVVLRFLPVREVVLTRPVAADARPFDISAPPNSTVAYSQSFGLKNARRRRTNNMGFFADFDFEPGAPVDLAIGDSYVEALQVEFAETFHQIWSRQSGRPVYPLGVSGAPLSQYEAYLDQACREFKVRRAVITIVANDFNESFHALRARDGFFHYRVVDGLGTEGGHLQATLQPTPFETTPLRALANSSSLVRYLFFNLEAGNLVRHLTRPGRGEVTRRVEPDQRAFTIGRQAIDLFLSRIGGYCLGPRELLLVIDGDRRRLYGGRPNRYLGAMREHFLARAGAAGFRVLDLEPVFAADYAAHGQMFNDPHEWHWNTHGHAVIAAAIAKAFAP
ncbi:MAG: hypothetical protein H6907_02900 [Hyphomicrobiales bacterium]|nr:hypothetical protein [Hyphomicrobiales bacterium]MCP5370655.1 hypothetical protein [Hyphomicrobiales bacterium]